MSESDHCFLPCPCRRSEQGSLLSPLVTKWRRVANKSAISHVHPCCCGLVFRKRAGHEPTVACRMQERGSMSLPAFTIRHTTSRRTGLHQDRCRQCGVVSNSSRAEAKRQLVIKPT